MRISDWSSDVCSSDLQRAVHTEPFADEVLVATATFVGHAVLQACHQREWTIAQLRRPAPAQVGAAVLAVQVDRTAALARVGLHEHRDRPHLRGLARPAVGHHLDPKCVVWGKSLSYRVESGGRRNIKKKKNKTHNI